MCQQKIHNQCLRDYNRRISDVFFPAYNESNTELENMGTTDSATVETRQSDRTRKPPKD